MAAERNRPTEEQVAKTVGQVIDTVDGIFEVAQNVIGIVTDSISAGQSFHEATTRRKNGPTAFKRLQHVNQGITSLRELANKGRRLLPEKVDPVSSDQSAQEK